MPSVGAAGFPVRYKLVGIAASLAALTYLDRVCISVLAPSITKEFRLTQVQMSYVFSAFTLAYAAFEIPTAWWADRIGSRAVVTRIVTWWSAFTMLTAAAFSYPSLLVLRFLFGIGEAGTWPNAARVFSRWIPARERGIVQGVFFAGAHLSGALTPALVLWMTTFLSWRQIFLCCGSVGFPAAVTMVIAANSASARMAGALIAISTASSMFTLAPSWASCIDIGERRAGVLSAAMNTSGNIGGFLSPIVLAYLVRWFSNWAIPLYVLAGLYFVAAVCWLVIRPDRPISSLMAVEECVIEPIL